MGAIAEWEVTGWKSNRCPGPIGTTEAHDVKDLLVHTLGYPWFEFFGAQPFDITVGLDPRDPKQRFFCGSFLRRGEVLAYVGSIQTLKGLKVLPCKPGPPRHRQESFMQKGYVSGALL